MLRQASDEAPRHPLVLNETARRLLLANDPARAHQLLEQAVKIDSTIPILWLNLAAALRSLKRPAEEWVALTRLLELEPRNLRAQLQKASLVEMKGDSRAAAAAYRSALQSIPPGADMPPSLRPVLEHANSVVEANNRALEVFLEQRMQELRSRHAAAPSERFEQCLAILLQKRRIYRQQPTFMYFPQLPEIEFFDRGLFPWLDTLEAATADIREELVKVLEDGAAALEPYVSHSRGLSVEQKWQNLNESRRWGVYFLWHEGVPDREHLARCPKTARALEAWPRWDVPGSGPTAVFSILEARTRIPPHHGVNNTRLIVHLPLIVPEGCGFRVGGSSRAWEPGKAFVFDDTIEHEAWNEGDLSRVVLILDVWNPLVTEVERDFVRAVCGGVTEFYQSPSPESS